MTIKTITRDDELVAISRRELAQIEAARVALYKLLEKQCANTRFLVELNNVTVPLWDIANKKRATLAAAPQPPVAERAEAFLNVDVERLAHRTAWRYKNSSDPHHSDTYTFNRETLLDFARKLRTIDAPSVDGEWCELFAEVRDNILHGRGNLDGMLDNEQTNAVLGELDRLDVPRGTQPAPRQAAAESVEPDAWQSMHFGTPVSETHNREEAEKWRQNGVAVRPLYAALSSSAPQPVDAGSAEIDRLRRDCAEAYQVVGALAGDHFDAPQVQKALDNLSAAANGDPRPHDDLLPFVAPVTS